MLKTFKKVSLSENIFVNEWSCKKSFLLVLKKRMQNTSYSSLSHVFQNLKNTLFLGLVILEVLGNPLKLNYMVEEFQITVHTKKRKSLLFFHFFFIIFAQRIFAKVLLPQAVLNFYLHKNKIISFVRENILYKQIF